MRGRPVAPSRRLVIVGRDAASMLRLRGGLIRAVTTAKHRVLCLTADSDAADHAALSALGATTLQVPLAAAGVQPLADRRSIEAIAARLAEWKPHAVLGYGLKPMLHAAIAAQRAAVPRIVPLVSTLDELAHRPGLKPGLGLRWLMKSGFKASHAVIFHNRDTAVQFASMDLMPPALSVHVVSGGGVDLEHFSATPLPPLSPSLVFAMIARRERARGIIEFCEAARSVKAKAAAARFILAGPAGRGRDAVTDSDLAAYAGIVECLGEQADVRPLLASCHVVVMPSHAEGMPRIVLEALAMGRPAITTDIAGCRETIDERVNGVLVQPRDALSLAAAMESFLKRPDLIAWMSKASRLKAERRFDANTVATETMQILGLERV